MSAPNSILVVAAILFVAENVYADTKTDIKSHCAEKWPTDYEMRIYCETETTEAWRRLSRTIRKYKKGSEERKIVNRCWSKWYPQIDMVEYCSDNQLAAFTQSPETTSPEPTDPGGAANTLQGQAKAFCRKKWTPDYQMIEHCVGKMRQAEINLAHILKRFDERGEEYRIIARCLDKWTPQIDMVEYCSKKQLEAYSKSR